MKRKGIKKLSLSRETLSTLDSSRLAGVAGAATTACPSLQATHCIKSCVQACTGNCSIDCE